MQDIVTLELSYIDLDASETQESMDSCISPFSVEDNIHTKSKYAMVRPVKRSFPGLEYFINAHNYHQYDK